MGHFSGTGATRVPPLSPARTEKPPLWPGSHFDKWHRHDHSWTLSPNVTSDRPVLPAPFRALGAGLCVSQSPGPRKAHMVEGGGWQRDTSCICPKSGGARKKRGERQGGRASGWGDATYTGDGLTPEQRPQASKGASHGGIRRESLQEGAWPVPRIEAGHLGRVPSLQFPPCPRDAE